MARASVLALAALCLVSCGALTPPPSVSFPPEIQVSLAGPNAKHETTRAVFDPPLDVRDKRLTVTVQVPPEFVRRPFSSVALWAKDAEYRWQNTTWAEGSLSPENPAFDKTTGTITLSYTPTPPSVSKQGWTAPDFDPSQGIRELGLKIATNSGATERYVLDGVVRVLDVKLESGILVPDEPARLTPLLRSDAGLPPRDPAPVPVKELVCGVGGYFRYGDLHRWKSVEPMVRTRFERQQANGLTGFRLMPAFDTRSQSGGLRVRPDEFAAMEAYLALAEQTGQRHHMVTLFDGAAPNDVLREAMTNRTAQEAFLATLRPFVKRFGNARIHGEPVVYDLVNEIHGVDGVIERQRQLFIEALTELFIEEAPGAVLSVGVGEYRELAYWLYLPERFKGRPVQWLFTVHGYGKEFDRLPNAWDLNLPDGAEIGVTEARMDADPAAAVQTIASKGYRWLLFWEDAQHDYDAAAHRQALDAAAP